VAHGVPSRIGQIHLYSLLKGLDGHDITILCFAREEEYRRDAEREIRQRRRLITIPAPHIAFIWRLLRALITTRPVAVESARSKEMKAALENLLHEHFDVVIFEQLSMAEYANCAFEGIKLLFPVDAVSRIKEQKRMAATNPLEKIGWYIDGSMTHAYERRVYSKAHGVLLVSTADVDYTLKHVAADPCKLYVLPNGVDIEEFRPDAHMPEAPNSLVFLGNMRNPANEDGILWFHRHVWPHLKARRQGVTLRIVGNEPGPLITALAADDPAIEVTGFVDDLRPYLSTAEVFVSPLQLGTGIKNRMLQAMAMGKAIVASPLSVEGIRLTDGKDVLVASNADAFQAAIVRLLGDAELRRDMGHNARLQAETYHSLQRTAEQFLEIIEKTRTSNGGMGVVRA